MTKTKTKTKAKTKIKPKTKIKKKVKKVIKAVSSLEKKVTKKHSLVKTKKFSLKGQVNMPGVNAKWNKGKPTVKLKNSANLSANYKVNKNVSLSGGVSYKTGSKPKYNVGVNNLKKNT